MLLELILCACPCNLVCFSNPEVSTYVSYKQFRIETEIMMIMT